MPSATTIAETYAEFAAREVRNVSPAYERVSLAVSRSGELLGVEVVILLPTPE